MFKSLFQIIVIKLLLYLNLKTLSQTSTSKTLHMGNWLGGNNGNTGVEGSFSGGIFSVGKIENNINPEFTLWRSV